MMSARLVRREFHSEHLRLQIAGQFVAAVDAVMTSLVVRQVLNAPTQCEISFGSVMTQAQVDLLLEALPIGAPIALRNSAAQVFSGQVTALDYLIQPDTPPRVVVRAYDALHRLRKQHPYRVWEAMNVHDIAKNIAGSVGANVDTGSAGEDWKYLIQIDNDLDFLIDLAQRAGMHLYLDGDTLLLISLDPSSIISGEAHPLVVGEALIEAGFSRNAYPGVRQAATQGWHPDSAQPQSETVNAGALPVLYDGMEPGRFNLEGLARLYDETAYHPEHAAALGQMTLVTNLAQERVVDGIAMGDSHLRPGLIVNVSGVLQPFGGNYRLTQVTHTHDSEHGYRTQFSSEPPALIARGRSAVITLGVVSKVDEGLHGRVRVHLPTYGSLETDWIPVVIAGAGKGRGLLVLPDVGDTVLIVLAHGDPAQGLVLGGIYGTGAAPGSVTSGGRTMASIIRTAGGQNILLDDRNGTLILENRDGSRLELTPDAVRLRADAPLDIDAGGHPIRIRGRRIDFEQG